MSADFLLTVGERSRAVRTEFAGSFEDQAAPFARDRVQTCSFVAHAFCFCAPTHSRTTSGDFFQGRKSRCVRRQSIGHSHSRHRLEPPPNFFGTATEATLNLISLAAHRFRGAEPVEIRHIIAYERGLSSLKWLLRHQPLHSAGFACGPRTNLDGQFALQNLECVVSYNQVATELPKEIFMLRGAPVVHGDTVSLALDKRPAPCLRRSFQSIDPCPRDFGVDFIALTARQADDRSVLTACGKPQRRQQCVYLTQRASRNHG
jgi:hypothetical protein